MRLSISSLIFHGAFMNKSEQSLCLGLFYPTALPAVHFEKWGVGKQMRALSIIYCMYIRKWSTIWLYKQVTCICNMINANLSLNRSIRRADIYKYRLIGRLFQTQMTAVYPVNTEWQGLEWLYTDTIYTLVLNIKYIARYSDLRTIFLAVIIILLA